MWDSWCHMPIRPFGYELETQISYRGTHKSLHQHRSEASSQHKDPFCFDWLNVQIWLSLQDVIRTRSKTPISQNALLHSYNDPIQSSAGSHLSNLQIKERHRGLGSAQQTGPGWGWNIVQLEKFPAKSKVKGQGSTLLPSQEVCETQTQIADKV